MYLAAQEGVHILETVFSENLITREINETVERITANLSNDKKIFMEPHLINSKTFSINSGNELED